MFPLHNLKFCGCLSKLVRADSSRKKKSQIYLFFLQILTVVTVNRVQDVCVNPIFREIDLDTLDQYFWAQKKFNDEFYRGNCEKFNAVHIGDFVLDDSN